MSQNIKSKNATTAKSKLTTCDCPCCAGKGYSPYCSTCRGFGWLVVDGGYPRAPRG